MPKFEIEYKVEEITCYSIACAKETETPFGTMAGWGGDRAIYRSKQEAERVAEALNADIARKIGRHL